MKMSDQYINDQLNTAQKLLWGGSETENIEAHNIIAKLISDRMAAIDQQGPNFFLTVVKRNTLKTIYKTVNS